MDNKPFIMRPAGFSLLPFIHYLNIKDGVMVEIGSYTGESTQYFAESGKFKEIYCIDPWTNGYDDTVVVSSHCDFAIVEEEFDARMAPFDFIKKIKNYSSRAAGDFSPSSLDLVYIDGNHAYDYVIDDIQLWLPKVKKGGYLAGHDYGIRDGVKPAVNKLLGDPEIVFSDTTWVFRI